jgi:3-phenylpropionate/trans-cinnamate dioxygenase ferredoxin component
MPGFVAVCRVDDVAPGEMRSFNLEGEDIAVANLEGEFVAFGDVCTHQQCSLAEGDLNDTTVICPCHGSEFDVRTGEVLAGPATEPEPSFEVAVEDGEVKVAL